MFVVHMLLILISVLGLHVCWLPSCSFALRYAAVVHTTARNASHEGGRVWEGEALADRHSASSSPSASASSPSAMADDDEMDFSLKKKKVPH